MHTTLSNENLDSFFEKNFEVICKNGRPLDAQENRAVDWKTHRVILIGEDHTSTFFREKYSTFIDMIAKMREVVVLVEGEKSMIPLEKNQSAQTCYISSNVIIYGSDDSTPKERYPKIPQLAKCVDLFLEYQLKLLESEKTEKNKLALRIEAFKILDKFLHTEKEIDQNIYLETLKEHFPSRTLSMIKTIKEVVNLHPEAIIFLIWGEHHVQQTIQDPRLSLNSLYEYFETIESMAVIKNKNACVIC